MFLLWTSKEVPLAFSFFLKESIGELGIKGSPELGQYLQITHQKIPHVGTERCWTCDLADDSTPYKLSQPSLTIMVW